MSDRLSRHYLPPMALAEDLPRGLLHKTFMVRELTPVPVAYPMHELERDYWLGGLSLDMAMQQGNSVDQSNEYFARADCYWQAVTDNPFDASKTTGIRYQARLMQDSLPAYRARRFTGFVPDDTREALDRKRATILRDVLAAPSSPEDRKNVLTAEIGAQLALSIVGTMSYPANGRESMLGANTATPEQRRLAHGQYLIREQQKVPISTALRRFKQPDSGLTVRFKFGELASDAIKQRYPVLQESMLFSDFADCGRMVAGWLIEWALYRNLESDQLTIAKTLGRSILTRADIFQAQRGSN